jgi:dihydrofolate reductase
MRKIIVSEFVTVDGMMSDPGDTMKWVTDNFNAKEGAYELDLYERIDTIMLGRTTYDIWAGYWPKALSDPKMPESDRKMAGIIDRKAKILVSGSRKTAYWGSGKTTQLEKIDRDEILELKKQPGGKDIGLIGSASIVQQLTALSLVDEYHLLFHPLIMGQGKPLFKPGKDSVRLKLAGTEDFGNGVVLQRYRS